MEATSIFSVQSVIYIVTSSRDLCPFLLQVCTRGGASLRGGHSLPLPNTQLATSRRRGVQRGVWHADIPQCTAAEDPEGGRVRHRQVGPRRVSG